MDNPFENEISFKGDFPYRSYSDWEELAKEIYKSHIPLQEYPLDEVTTKPLYTKEDHGNLLNRLPHVKKWQLCQLLSSSGENGNESLKNAISAGAEALEIELHPTTLLAISAAKEISGRNGFIINRYSDFAKLFAEIDLEKYTIYMQAGYSAFAQIVYLKRFAENSNFDLSLINGAIEMDPMWIMARSGYLAAPIDSIFDEMAALLKWSAKYLPNVKTIGINAAHLNDAGASVVQELAIAAAVSASYIRALLDRKIDIRTIISNIRITFSASSDFYMNVAKIRAMRYLWANLIAAFGGEGEIDIHCRTSQREKTENDTHTNIIRFTQQSLAAIIGGANTVSVASFGNDNEFSRRISRNILLILKNEAKGEALANSMQGSYFIDSLTLDLAEKAWTLFQEVENNGGYYKELLSGTPQKLIKSLVEKRAQRLQNGDDKLIGINVFREGEKVPVKKNGEVFADIKIDDNQERITALTSADIEDKVKENRSLNEIYWRLGKFNGQKIEAISPISLEKLCDL
jgi:methylmalonyl-CoA mutase